MSGRQEDAGSGRCASSGLRDRTLDTAVSVIAHLTLQFAASGIQRPKKTRHACYDRGVFVFIVGPSPADLSAL